MIPYTITVIEFWRRTLDGREYINSRLFKSEMIARRYLIINNYRLFEDNIYQRGEVRAVVTERTVE